MTNATQVNPAVDSIKLELKTMYNIEFMYNIGNSILQFIYNIGNIVLTKNYEKKVIQNRIIRHYI